MTAVTFTEDWFPHESRLALDNLARRVQCLNGDLVEIGSWEGRSTLVLAEATAPRVVHAVDTWEGSPGEVSADLARERDVYTRFVTNTVGHPNIVAHRTGWRDYFAADAGPLRFVFIDAEHTYREVWDTIETVLPRMVRGGIICGDDMHHPPVWQAVSEWFGRSTPTLATLWWHRTL